MTDEKVETPRTDAFRRIVGGERRGERTEHEQIMDLIGFAETLERELSAAAAELERVKGERDDLLKMNTNQKAQIEGRHQYHGQDKQFQIDHWKQRATTAEAELERVKGEEEMVTRAYDAIFPYVPDAIPLDEKINELLKLYEQAEAALEKAREKLHEAIRLLVRYRQETPPGHQPHMISHEADAAIDAALSETGRGEK